MSDFGNKRALNRNGVVMHFFGMSREWSQSRKQFWHRSCVLWQRKDRTDPTEENEKPISAQGEAEGPGGDGHGCMPGRRETIGVRQGWVQ